MIDQPATAADFKRWRSHAKGCDMASLIYIIKDCREAADAMSTHSLVREGYYLDQMMTYADEKRARTI